MRYRRLGKTQMRVSVIGVGTWQFGGEWGKDFQPDEVEAILKTAGDLGVNLIDTAECYGDHLSERLIGQAIKGQRDNWIIATKFGHRFLSALERTNIYEPKEIQRQLEDSLRALKTEYIDLYQFHSGTDAMFDTEGLWDMLGKQQRMGRIRHLGLSVAKSYDGEHQILDAPSVGAETLQVVYNRLHRKHEARTFESCTQMDLGVLARVPLASGYLTGRYTKETQFGPNDVRGAWISEAERLSMLEEVEKIRETEVPAGLSMAQWALVWPLRHPAVGVVIPGCKNAEQARSNAMAADLDIVDDGHRLAVS
jgi:myo-inositol catabolism protein IolS